MIQIAEGFLYRWGKWCNENPGQCISILGRYIDEGAGAAHIATNPEIPMSDEIQLTEEAVLLLVDTDSQLPLVLKYVERTSPREACRRCKCHPREYNKLVNYGIYFVAGYISGVNDVKN